VCGAGPGAHPGPALRVAGPGRPPGSSLVTVLGYETIGRRHVNAAVTMASCSVLSRACWRCARRRRPSSPVRPRLSEPLDPSHRQGIGRIALHSRAQAVGSSRAPPEAHRQGIGTIALHSRAQAVGSSRAPPE
jgi:hypothetical protein